MNSDEQSWDCVPAYMPTDEMKIIPVLDLMNGLVVRGVAGQRDQYRPVESHLASSAKAIDVAYAFREHLGLSELYVADLDAIVNGQPNLEMYRQLTSSGFSILLDAGLKDSDQAARYASESGDDAISLIMGLETIPGPDFVATLVNQYSSERLILSLDMQDGQLLGKLDAWKSRTPYELACEAVDLGVQRMIVLDLAQVGVGDGLTTIQLCQQLQSTFPNLEIITGGGVRDTRDLARLSECGVDGVLVATALHNGAITAEEIREFHSM